MIVCDKDPLFRSRQIRPHLVEFCSNDYLGISNDSKVKQIFQDAFAHYPAGSGGSAVICGYHEIHHDLEQRFCQALDAEAALLFTSGYLANLSVMLLIAEFQFTAVMDKWLHASFYDGLKQSRGKFKRFPHQQYDSLRSIETQKIAPLLILESVYSMGGHVAPLKRLAQNLQMPLIVDEAHAFGLYGKEGLGGVQAAGLSPDRVPLRMIPFGKAFAAQGAIVLGKKDWIQALLQVSRGAIYSTAMSPAYAAALCSLFEYIRQADDKRKRLFENITYFRQLIMESTLHWEESTAAIQHLSLGNAASALALEEYLQARGIFCKAIRSPTVPMKFSGLRVVIHADHTEQQLLYLMQMIHAGTR